MAVQSAGSSIMEDSHSTENIGQSSSSTDGLQMMMMMMMYVTVELD